MYLMMKGLEAVRILYLSIATVSVVIVAFVVSGRARPARQQMDRVAYFRSATWQFIQILLIGSCFIAAAWRSLLLKDGPDAVAASFLVLALLLAIVPWVSKIVFPGKAEVDFLDTAARNDARELEEKATIARLAMARAAQFVAELQASLIAEIRDPNFSEEDRRNAIDEALLYATEVLSEWLRPRPSKFEEDEADLEPVEEIRVSAWVPSAQNTLLTFLRGWPQEAVAILEGTAFEMSDEPIGTVFSTGQYLNFQMLPVNKRPFSPLPPGAPFNGILLLPMQAGGKIVGVLLIERENITRFDASQATIGRALAAFYATALT